LRPTATSTVRGTSNTFVRRVRGQSPHCPCGACSIRWVGPRILSVFGFHGEALESSRPSHPTGPERIVRTGSARSNLAVALGLRSRWRLSKPQPQPRLEIHENPDSAHPGTPAPCTLSNVIHVCAYRSTQPLEWRESGTDSMRLCACSILMARLGYSPNAMYHVVCEAIPELLPRGRGRRWTDAKPQQVLPTQFHAPTQRREASASHMTVELCACARAMD
jgi:hypothetical protein